MGVFIILELDKPDKLHPLDKMKKFCTGSWGLYIQKNIVHTEYMSTKMVNTS